MKKETLDVNNLALFANYLIEKYDFEKDSFEKDNILFILLSLENVLDRGRIYRKNGEDLKILNNTLDLLREKIFKIKEEDSGSFNEKVDKEVNKIKNQYRI